MTYQEALHQARKHQWWSEDAPGKYQYSYWMHSFVEQRKYYHPDYLSVMFCVSDHGFVEEKTPSDERLKVYDWVKLQQQNDSTYINRLHDHAAQMKQHVLVTTEEAIATCTSANAAELLGLFRAVKTSAKNFVRWGTFLECVDDYNTTILPQKMRHAYPEFPEDEVTNRMIVLSTPRIVSFMEKFQQQKAAVIMTHRTPIEHAEHISDMNDPAALEAMRSIVNAYDWITVNYGGSAPLTVEELFKQLHQEARQQSDAQLKDQCRAQETKIQRVITQQEELLKTNHLPKDLELDFMIMRSFGAWMDERKETMVRVNNTLYRLFGRCEELTGVPQDDLGDYFDEELKTLLVSKQRVSEAVLKERRQLAVYATVYDGDDGSTLTVFTGEEATELARILRGTQNDRVVGIVASKGTPSISQKEGTVQVVLDVSKESFVTDNILVTTMTRPEFVPLLQQASAIITDEGGITCHAAVISRELGIPCIIGTRHATKQLKTGDTVHMNLETGEIKLR